MKFCIRWCVFFLLAGCVTVQQEDMKPMPSISTSKAVIKPIEVIALENNEPQPEVMDGASQEPLPARGVILAKTDFQGVLLTNYVRLGVKGPLGASVEKFQIHIGEKTGQKTFPWEIKTVQPGYFTLELLEGQYEIFDITIPVAATTATEAVNIHFEVLPDAVTYLGTLQLVGTKERIKLGGVPVIKPGFDYDVRILNQENEGLQIFQQRFVETSFKMHSGLMQLGISP